MTFWLYFCNCHVVSVHVLPQAYRQPPSAALVVSWANDLLAANLSASVPGLLRADLSIGVSSNSFAFCVYLDAEQLVKVRYAYVCLPFQTPLTFEPSPMVALRLISACKLPS